MGMAEFFAMEAGEYLERLDAMVSGPEAPDPEEFQRVTRALRGAALMANRPAIAQAAGAFEQLARGVRQGSRPWDEATRQLAVRAVDDLKVFVRRAGEWSQADDARAADLTASLGGPAGRASQVPRPSVAGGPDAGTRAFVAREGAALASALDRAGKLLAQNPLAHDPLQAVLNVMQPLRGLASLADLPPLPDLLEGIELAVSETMRSPEPRRESGEVFTAAAKALSQAAQQVASDGRADPEADATRHFAGLLGGFLGLDRSVVPIETLFPEGPGPHIVERGTIPGSRARLGHVELVAHGEHLRQVADGLERATSPTQRGLRAQTLAGTLRALEQGIGGALAEAATSFARAVRQAIADGSAVASPREFAARLRDVGAALSAAAHESEANLAERVRAAGAALLGDAAAPASAPSEAVPPLAQPAPEPEPAAPPTPPTTTPTTPRPSAAKAALVNETPDLIGSLARYRRYAEALGFEHASIDEVLAGPPAEPVAPTPGSSADLRPITDFCYSPRAALERALALQSEVQAAIASGNGGATASDLLEEVFDLVQLSLQQ